MLNSNTKHQWAYSLGGVGFFTPVYDSGCNGGSLAGWPSGNPSLTGGGDTRTYISFWACAGNNGGCCATDYANNPYSWNLAFQMHVQYMLRCNAGERYDFASGICVGKWAQGGRIKLQCT